MWGQTKKNVYSLVQLAKSIYSKARLRKVWIKKFGKKKIFVLRTMFYKELWVKFLTQCVDWNQIGKTPEK